MQAALKRNLKNTLSLFKESFTEWQNDRASTWAASLAYYTVFSMAPLLVIVIGVAGVVFGEEAARGQIFGQLQALIGPEGAQFVQTALKSAHSEDASRGIWSTIIGTSVLLFGASQVFSQLQDALNAVWGVDNRGESIKTVVKKRVLTFGMVLGIGFLLLVSTIASAALSAASNVLTGFVSPRLLETLYFSQIVNISLSFFVSALLFAMIYKFLPDVNIAWRDTWLGAFITASLFSIGKSLIGLYIGNSALSSSYGAAGSLAVFLVWVYYSAQIMFFGAEITEVYSRRKGEWNVPAGGGKPAVRAGARAETGTTTVNLPPSAGLAARPSKHSGKENPRPGHPL